MKNLLELHADASDEVSLLDDSEGVQYVVGDVSDWSRDLATAPVWFFQRATVCALLFPLLASGALSSLSFPERGEGLSELRLPIPPFSRVVLTSDGALCFLCFLVAALCWSCAMCFVLLPVPRVQSPTPTPTLPSAVLCPSTCAVPSGLPLHPRERGGDQARGEEVYPNRGRVQGNRGACRGGGRGGAPQGQALL